MSPSYDLVVLGSGTAAQVTSAQVRAVGWTVAVIDSRPLGGTCVLRGCDPKKLLVSGEEPLDAARRMRGHGVEGDLHIRWPDLMAFKRSFTDPVPAKQKKRYGAQGIDVFHGAARFIGADMVDVHGIELKARHVLIATGARPVPLGIPGEEYVVTSDDFLELDSLPAHIVLVGGGYIAAEFSHLAARAGSRVTVLEQGAGMMHMFDPDLVGLLMESFDTLGIDVRIHSTVKRVEKAGQGLSVYFDADGREQVLIADLVVHAAGRAPDLGGLDLASAGIALDNGRLKLNEYLQSVSNPRVYAAGDAAGSGPPLTPVASHDAKVVAGNLLEGNKHRPDYRGVPSVAFTIPPIAAVGLTEANATAQGLRFRVKWDKVPQWFTARRLAEPVYGFKTIIEEGSGRILGAHLVGPDAQEVINIFALAIRHGLTCDQLKETMFAYPTATSDVGYMV